MTQEEKNYPQGSRFNPFAYDTYTELVQHNNWNGGWVLHDSIRYYTESSAYYIGKGEMHDPYPYNIYSDMRHNQMWTGGWVIKENTSIVYITKDNTEYDLYSNYFATESNPCPIAIFEDMFYNTLWKGGWIEYEDGSKYFMVNYDIDSTSGSGCGCGCGCGSNSGSSSGSGSNSGSSSGSSSGSGSESGGIGNAQYIGSGSIVAAMVFSGAGEIIVSWNSGYLNQAPQATPSVSIKMPQYLDKFYDIEEHLGASWSGGNSVRISGFINVRYHATGITLEEDENLRIEIGLGSIAIPSSYFHQQ